MATTVEELKQEYPQLVALIEEQAAADAIAAAVQAERQRIQEIDSIAASIADPELVEIAKFGDAKSGATPMDAKELAFTAMQQTAKLGEGFLAGHTKDYAQSGAAEVEGVPSNETAEKNPEEGVAEIVALHRAVKTGGKVK